jgi:uncharacterized protein YgbK (DUF1537 family)
VPYQEKVRQMSLNFKEILSLQPPEYNGELLYENFSPELTIVILDDDPTGCQTVSDVPLLFIWEKGILTEAFRKQVPLLFILTNSRSMNEGKAEIILSEILQNLKDAADIANRKLLVVSRSDSTLRGHYPLETELIIQHLGLENPVQCLIPAFFQGGRFTVNDIHYVKEGESLTPAAETQFARDASFGFSSSDLKIYVEEKTAGAIKQQEVLSFSLDDLRKKGPEFIYEKLQFTDKKVCIVNALSRKDLDVFAIGARRAVNKGRNLVFRIAASFINSLANLPVSELINPSDYLPDKCRGMLFIVGSYVKKSSDQLGHLLMHSTFKKYELDVEELVNGNEMKDIHDELSSEIENGNDCILYTTRKLVRGQSVLENLKIGSMVSDFIARNIRKMDTPPGIIVTKGGITSHIVAKEGMGTDEARVLGQVLPGVPVIKPVTGRYQNTVQVIFPGNVGEKDSLSLIYKKLKGL